MTEASLIARLRDGRCLPIESCSCGTCQNEWFMASLSPEWMPAFCPYCGIKFVRKTTDGEPAEFKPVDVLSEVIEERDKAQNAADKLASMVLGEPIDWPFHDEAWDRAARELENRP